MVSVTRLVHPSKNRSIDASIGKDNFEPPDNTATTSTGHIQFQKFDLPDLYNEPPLKPAMTPTTNHRIKFDVSELHDHNSKLPPEDNALLPYLPAMVVN